MSTILSQTFKNNIINSISGRASNNYVLNNINAYSGARAADPSTAPVGTFVISGSGAAISTNMTQPSGGISQLTTPISSTAAATVTATIARIADSSGSAAIDTDLSIAGGGGGVIVPTVTSTNGAAFVFSQFSIKLPSANGTLMMNDALRDKIVEIIAKTAANIGLGSSASIKIYSGSAPANANMAATGTLLLTLTTAAGGASWNSASGGSASLVSNITAAAGNTGTAGYARIEKGTYVLQGSVGTSSADFILDSLSMTSGLTYSLTNATITL